VGIFASDGAKSARPALAAPLLKYKRDNTRPK
jgi:hypothetical protein